MDLEQLQLEKKQLIDLIKLKSYKEGDFTLVSGQKSTYYIDLKHTALHPIGASLIGKLFYKFINEKFSNKVQLLAGMTLGADPLICATQFAAFQNGKKWPVLIVRKEPKKHGTHQYVEGMKNFKPGDQAIVLEDVASTGGSSLKAIERLEAEGVKVLAVFTVVDRQMGAEENFNKKEIPFFSLIKISELKGR